MLANFWEQSQEVGSMIIVILKKGKKSWREIKAFNKDCKVNSW